MKIKLRFESFSNQLPICNLSHLVYNFVSFNGVTTNFPCYYTLYFIVAMANPTANPTETDQMEMVLVIENVVESVAALP